MAHGRYGEQIFSGRPMKPGRCLGVRKVKKKTARQKVKEKASRKAAAKEDDCTKGEESVNGAGNVIDHLPNHMKRKHAKRMRLYARLQENVEALHAKKTISKKKHRRKKKPASALTDMSCLNEFLPTFTDKVSLPQPFAVGTKKYKTRHHILEKETKQIEAVLAHPEFRENPFSAIQRHLEVTLGPHLRKEPQDEPEKKKKTTKQSKKKGKQNMQPMEM
eukprot:TRINITY_DN12241_c0_g2_i1.p1 TRINITY_DN12241_c0_g2~~TRINITY_DN12241_c0_g2_i1.p1  ORF type:complete len:219 (+),score=50.25 TRINITY_DN12241_c0_g2_i1:106-762(+)